MTIACGGLDIYHLCFFTCYREKCNIKRKIRKETDAKRLLKYYEELNELQKQMNILKEAEGNGEL